MLLKIFHSGKSNFSLSILFAFLGNTPLLATPLFVKFTDLGLSYICIYDFWLEFYSID